jgi:hypothetical protein
MDWDRLSMFINDHDIVKLSPCLGQIRCGCFVTEASLTDGRRVVGELHDGLLTDGRVISLGNILEIGFRRGSHMPPSFSGETSDD